MAEDETIALVIVCIGAGFALVFAVLTAHKLWAREQLKLMKGQERYKAALHAVETGRYPYSITAFHDEAKGYAEREAYRQHIWIGWFAAIFCLLTSLLAGLAFVLVAAGISNRANRFEKVLSAASRAASLPDKEAGRAQDVGSELERLGNLLRQGLLTLEEFSTAKAKLLGQS